MISLAAPAKINWALNLAGRRADGYHELDMLMQSVSLCDRLDLEPAEELALTCDDPAVPCDERNLILRAARALRAEEGTQRGARIRLTKRIPAMAGLGGGSSDCAAALVGLNRLWNLGISHRRLMEIGLTLAINLWRLFGVVNCLLFGALKVLLKSKKRRKHFSNRRHL